MKKWNEESTISCPYCRKKGAHYVHSNGESYPVPKPAGWLGERAMPTQKELEDQTEVFEIAVGSLYKKIAMAIHNNTVHNIELEDINEQITNIEKFGSSNLDHTLQRSLESLKKERGVIEAKVAANRATLNDKTQFPNWTMDTMGTIKIPTIKELRSLKAIPIDDDSSSDEPDVFTIDDNEDDKEIDDSVQPPENVEPPMNVEENLPPTIPGAENRNPTNHIVPVVNNFDNAIQGQALEGTNRDVAPEIAGVNNYNLDNALQGITSVGQNRGGTGRPMIYTHQRSLPLIGLSGVNNQRLTHQRVLPLCGLGGVGNQRQHGGPRGNRSMHRRGHPHNARVLRGPRQAETRHAERRSTRQGQRTRSGGRSIGTRTGDVGRVDTSVREVRQRRTNQEVGSQNELSGEEEGTQIATNVVRRRQRRRVEQMLTEHDSDYCPSE